MHALIVEDELLVAMAVEEVLTGLGFTSVECAPTEEQAVAAGQRRRPDLVTADVRLRSGNGVSAVARIRELYPQVPVIFMTGNRESTPLNGGDLVLCKPFSDRSLVAMVTRALAG